MARPLKEQDLDQSMWEEVNFALVDADGVLAQLEAAGYRDPHVQLSVRALRVHVNNTRDAVTDWGKQKGLRHMRPELELMAAGGLQRLIEARRRRRLAAERVSPAEAEVV